jgi:hypothetical protein
VRAKGARESEVQAGILAYLGTRPDVWFWRQNTGGVRAGNRFIRFGLPGAPDVVVIQAPTGRFVGIEVKREVGGSVSGVQREWGNSLTAFGGLYVVARSIEDVAEALGPPTTRVLRPIVRGRIIRR